jgi:putative inorganic carbon (hco3(-)) transporter
MLLSIAAAQIFFSLAGVCYAADLLRRPRVPAFPPVKLPLALFCIFTALSIVGAENPIVGWTVVRKLTLLLIILFTVNLMAGYRQLVAIYRVIFVESALAGLLAVWQFMTQYRQVRAEHPGKFYYFMTLFRIHGFQGHWMNFGGQQMLIFIALAAYVTVGLQRRGKGRGTDFVAPAPCTGRATGSALSISEVGPGLAPAKADPRVGPKAAILGWWLVLAVVAISIVLNFTRGVWLGCGVAVLYIVARWCARWLLALPVLALAVYLASPGLVRDRLQTLFHPTADPSIAVRIEMWHIGLAMIRRHPFTGVGPNNIPEVYLTYLPPGTQMVPAWHEHLHDVYLQLGAERGLPCLAAWVWFMGALAWHILRVRGRLEYEGGSAWIADAAFAGWLAFVVEGFFEFNFGTTPVLMLFLFVMSAPFAVEHMPVAENR